MTFLTMLWSTSIESKAATYQSFSDSVSVPTTLYNGGFRYETGNTGTFNPTALWGLEDDVLYKIDCSFLASVDYSTLPFYGHGFVVSVDSDTIDSAVNLGIAGGSSSASGQGTFYILGGDTASIAFNHCYSASGLTAGTAYTFIFHFTLTPTAITELGSLSENQDFVLEYNRGFQAGKAEGLTEGYDNGYDVGYESGETAGIDIGYQTGYLDGETAGYNAGYSSGQQSGYVEGLEEGYQDGYDAGYEQGYQDAVNKLNGVDNIGDTYSFTGTWSGKRIYLAQHESGASFGQVNFKTENSKDFFKKGHTYRLTGSVYGAQNGYSIGYYSGNWYFPTENGNVLMTSSNTDYYSPIDITFKYYGQNLGPIYEYSFSRTTDNNGVTYTYHYATLVVHEDYPLVFTDLGVCETEGDIVKRIDETTQLALQEEYTQTEVLQEQTENQKSFFDSFFDNLKDGLLGLFVPSEDEMSDLLDELNQFFSDKFGFLYAPFDYFIQLCGTLISPGNGTGITFPSFSMMGYTIWSAYTYDLSSEPLVGDIFASVRVGTGILLVGAFLMYLQDFFKQKFGGDG